MISHIHTRVCTEVEGRRGRERKRKFYFFKIPTRLFFRELFSLQVFMKGWEWNGRARCVYRVLTEALLAELPFGIPPAAEKRQG